MSEFKGKDPSSTPRPNRLLRSIGAVAGSFVLGAVFYTGYTLMVDANTGPQDGKNGAVKIDSIVTTVIPEDGVTMHDETVAAVCGATLEMADSHKATRDPETKKILGALCFDAAEKVIADDGLGSTANVVGDPLKVTILRLPNDEGGGTHFAVTAEQLTEQQ